MATPSIIIGDGKWAVREDNLLGYFQGEHNKYLPKPMDWTRASDGTLTNKDGVIENTPYNLISYSEDFSVWGGSGVVNPNVTTAPNGELTASSIYASNTSNNKSQVSTPILPSTQYTVSCYVKDKGDDIANVWFYSVETSFVKIKFTFSTETISNSGTAEDSSGFETLDNGWYRVYFVFTTDTVVTSEQIQLNRGVAEVTTYYWGAQLVEGTEAKPYYKTEDRLNIPRIDFSDSSRGALLLEPQRTNLITYSEDFSDASWTVLTTNITTAFGYTSPSGQSNATRLTATANSARFRVNSATITSGLDYTNSIYIRLVSGVGEVSFFDVDGGSDTINLTSAWVKYSNPALSSSTQGRWILDITNNGDVIEVWGAQLEEGSYPTTYIPTNGSTVTRLADTGTNCGTVNDFNSEEGVLFVEAAALADDGTNRRISINDGTSANRVVISYNSSSNLLEGFYTVGSVTQGYQNYTLSDTTLFTKVAFRWALNDFSLWTEGINRGTDITGNVLAANVLTKLSFNNGATETLYGKIEGLEVYKEYLDDTAMAELTT